MKTLRTYCSIIVLLVAIQARAYEPVSPSFTSAGSAVFYGSQERTPLYTTRSSYSQSLSSISASNFETLNGEGGEFYNPPVTGHSIRGISRPDDEEAIGEIGERSPIGDVPWMLFMALAIGYLGFKKLKQKMSRKSA